MYGLIDEKIIILYAQLKPSGLEQLEMCRQYLLNTVGTRRGRFFENSTPPPR